MAHTEDVRFTNGENTLAGTLHLPDGAGPHPAIAMLQGSGPTDRDSGGYFPHIRDPFLNIGLAVLSWDKPGIGESTGQWTNQTFFDRADEALAAIALLRNHEGIDPARIGIWGHSQGGWVGPLAASQTRDLAFLIVNSGPTIPAIEQDLHGIEHTLCEKGASNEEVQEALKFIGQLHEAARKGAPYDEVASHIEKARGTPGFEYFGYVGPDVWHFFVINAQRPYDPVPPLSQITCPILAIFGELDPLVPVQESARVFASINAPEAGRDVTVRIFPGSDHRIRVGEPFVFAPGYLDTMTDWIQARIRPPQYERSQ